MAHRNQADAKPLAGEDAKHLLKLDTTDMTPAATAMEIEARVSR